MIACTISMDFMLRAKLKYTSAANNVLISLSTPTRNEIYQKHHNVTITIFSCEIAQNDLQEIKPLKIDYFLSFWR
jgi:hypothetical protein